MTPPDLSALLTGCPDASLPESLTWNGVMWTGAPSRVNYPEDGHDLLPDDPDNWWYAHRSAIVVRALDRVPVWPRAIWDIGGGTGLMAPALRAAGWSTVVVEPVARAAERAVARADLVIAATLGELALPRASVPAIGMFDVLEHLDDPEATLRECARVIAPDGVLVVTVPAHQWLWSATDVAAGHRARYSPALLRRQAVRAGLDLTHARRFFVALVPGAMGMRLASGARAHPDEALAREMSLLNAPAGRQRLLRGLVATDRVFAGPLRSPVGLSLIGILRKPARR